MLLASVLFRDNIGFSIMFSNTCFISHNFLSFLNFKTVFREWLTYTNVHINHKVTIPILMLKIICPEENILLYFFQRFLKFFSIIFIVIFGYLIAILFNEYFHLQSHHFSDNTICHFNCTDKYKHIENQLTYITPYHCYSRHICIDRRMR